MTAIVIAVVGVVFLATGGGAYGAYRYEANRAHLILPGVSIAGVDVSGLTREEAVAAVSSAADSVLASPFAVHAGDGSWTITPQELGEQAVVEDAVDRALAAGDHLGTLARFWHRVRSAPLGVAVDLRYEVPSDVEIRSFVQRIAHRVAVAPTDASISLDEHGELVFLRSIHGSRLDVAGSIAAILSALDSGTTSISLGMRSVPAKVTRTNLGPTIVVRVDQNRLYLYDGFKVAKTYSVATAKPGYTTPDGVWTIWDKLVNPTWYNPALDGWGADLPAVIPGGPGNPMGTRALYIDAPGLIRIHGTSDDASIGRWASHGCIRMHNWEVEELYDIVAQGTHVIVAGYRPSWAQEWDVPTRSDI